MPSKTLREDLLASSFDKYDEMEPDPVANHTNIPSKSSSSSKKSSLKPSYENKGLDTSQLYVPKAQLENNTKLVLDNDPLTLDDTIPTYSRTGKKAYREVQYKDDYTPQEFTNPENVKKKVTFSDQKNDFKNDSPTVKVQDQSSQPRRSERLRTKWKPTKIAKVMFATMKPYLYPTVYMLNQSNH